jgi:subtilisin family serine protease
MIVLNRTRLGLCCVLLGSRLLLPCAAQPAVSLLPTQLDTTSYPDQQLTLSLAIGNSGSVGSNLTIHGLIVQPVDEPVPTAAPMSAPVASGATGDGEVVPGEILVRYRPGMRVASSPPTLTAMGASTTRVLQRSGLHVVRIPSGTDMDQALAAARADPRVAYAEPNYVIHADVIPDDPSFSQQWGLHNTGQFSGTPGADIAATAAWEVTTGGDVVVGVIDSGMDLTHPDLAANLWINPGEIAGNGIDDDGNGFIDDMHGWDFVDGDNDPSDVFGHGTQVAGVIGAVGNNGLGVVGVAWQTKLMVLRILDDAGFGSTADAIEAIEYAEMMGVPLTNNSWGGDAYSQALNDAISAAGTTGMSLVMAAGNSNLNNDQTPHYPSDYEAPNIISVAATDVRDRRASFSNFGLTSVDLGAPGVSIRTTSLGAGYTSVSGTSMATPHVSGIAALVLARFSGLSPAQVKSRLLAGAEPASELAGITVTGGRANALAALEGGVAWLQVADTTAVVSQGGVVTLPVRFDARGLQPDSTYQASILVRTDDPATPVVVVAAQLVVIPRPVVSVSLPLATGWNLVSWHVDTSNDSIAAITADLGSQLTRVFAFETAALNPNAATGLGAKQYDPLLPQLSDLRLADHRQGFWFLMSQPDTLIVSGTLLSGSSTPIPLVAGFNLVSYTSDAVDSASHALVTILDHLSRAFSYESALNNPNPQYGEGIKQFDVLFPDLSDLQLVAPGLGYGIQVDVDDTLRYPDAGVTPAPTGQAWLPQGVDGDPEAVGGPVVASPVGDPPLRHTPHWIDVFGDLTIGGLPAPVGTVVEVVDGSGTVAGRQRLVQPGEYGFLHIYLDDPESVVDEGAEPGEWLTLRVDAQPAAEQIQWTRFGDVSRLDLAR